MYSTNVTRRISATRELSREFETYEAMLEDGFRFRTAFCVSLEKSSASMSERYKIEYAILVVEKTELVPLAEHSVLHALPHPIRPDVGGWVDLDTGVVQIERVSRGFISPGQNFLVRTLRSLLAHAPETKTLVLANVTHRATRQTLEAALDAGPPHALSDNENPGPLIGALLKCGFTNLSAMSQGSARCLRAVRCATASTLG